MTGVEKCSTTKPGLPHRVRQLARTGAATMGLALVTTIAATAVVSPGPVAADPVSNLQAQAAHIARDLVLEQLKIGAYQQQYEIDAAKVKQDQTAIKSAERHIQADDRRVERDRERLRAEALWAYMNAGTTETAGALALFQGNERKAASTAEYEQVASGDIATTVAVLHTEENGLRAEQAMLERRQAQDQATTNQQAMLNGAAHQTEVELESKQSQITGELAVAVAQQQAAQAAAAAAAVRAAQAAAATVRTPAVTNAPASSLHTAPPASPITTSTAQPAPSITSTAPQGLPAGTSAATPSLPPFLVCVLQAESSGNYRAVSPGGTYMGGFQFSQATWNEAATLAGMPQLIDVPPNQATPAEQDDLAIALYNADGQQPWYDPCRTS